MNASRAYSFSLIRYVPDIIREEFVNIGVLICDPNDVCAPMLRMTRDWTRLLSLDESADIQMLEALETDLSLQLEKDGIKGACLFIEGIQESFCNGLQVTQYKSRSAESMESLAQELMVLYVLPPAKGALFPMALGKLKTYCLSVSPVDARPLRNRCNLVVFPSPSR